MSRDELRSWRDGQVPVTLSSQHIQRLQKHYVPDTQRGLITVHICEAQSRYMCLGCQPFD